MEEQGRKIMNVYCYIQQFFTEISQLLKMIDDIMEKNEWNALYGNNVTADCSKSLLEPKRWLPHAIFRVYATKDNSNIIKGVTVNYQSELEQPIIISGLIEYKDKNQLDSWDDYWILWRLWMTDKNKFKKLDGTIYSKFETERMYPVNRARLFAHYLTNINNEENIKEKITKPLIQLE